MTFVRMYQKGKHKHVIATCKNSVRAVVYYIFKQTLSTAKANKSLATAVFLVYFMGRRKIDLITLNVKLTLRGEGGVSWVWD